MMIQTLAAGFAFVAASAMAAPIAVESYDVINGGTGSYTYWDDTYDGLGDVLVTGSPLSGGTGDLTDGIIAMSGWVAAEAPAGPGPYVGWLRSQVDISFDFGKAVTLESMTIWYDDSEGSGGVDHIDRVDVLGLDSFLFSDPVGGGFASLTIKLGGLVTSALDIRVFGSQSWIFISEIQFDGRPDPSQAIPVPGAALLLGPVVPLLMRLRKK